MDMECQNLDESLQVLPSKRQFNNWIQRLVYIRPARAQGEVNVRKTVVLHEVLAPYRHVVTVGFADGSMGLLKFDQLAELLRRLQEDVEANANAPSS